MKEQNNSRKPDRRVLHTKRLIYEAIYALIKVKPVSKISVTELCEYATINRNTFYCHYNVPSDVINEICSEFMQQISLALVDETDSRHSIATTCHILKSHPDICRLLFHDNAELNFAEDILLLSSVRNHKKMQAKANPLSPVFFEMMSSFTIAGASAALRVWIQSGMQENPELVADFIHRLCYHGSTELSVNPPADFC